MDTCVRNCRRRKAICRRSLIYRIELSVADALFSRNSEDFNLDQITAIHCLGSHHGGIVPTVRRRSVLALTVVERVDISRGLASGPSTRDIAKGLERAAATGRSHVTLVSDADHGTTPRTRKNRAWRARPMASEANAARAFRVVRVLVAACCIWLALGSYPAFPQTPQEKAWEVLQGGLDDHDATRRAAARPLGLTYALSGLGLSCEKRPLHLCLNTLYVSRI